MGAPSILSAGTGHRPALTVAAIVGAGLIAAAATAYVFYPKDAAAAMDRGYYSTARNYYQIAAQSGDPAAQNALGNLYYLGLGGDRNYKLAADWYLQSAAQAHAPAQMNLARLFSQGLGVKKDVLRSVGWLRQARINGSEVAENHMRWLAGSLTLAPGQIQRARDLYRNLEDLLPQAAKQ